jgi:hypothetical protein
MNEAAIFYMGMRVVAHDLPPEPVLQISPDFPYCSPEFRRGWDAWALERFGTVDRIFQFRNPIDGRGVLAVPRRVMEALRKLPTEHPDQFFKPWGIT